MRFKKLLSAALSLMLVFSMSACSDEDEYDDDYGYGYDDDYYYDDDDDYYDDDDDDDDGKDYDFLDELFGDYEDDDYYYSGEIPEGDVAAISGVVMSVDNSTGDLSIVRAEIEKNERSDDGVWTIFVYLCGTDLESDSSMATADMEEMAAATHSDNVRFVVETGGTDDWTMSGVSDSKIQRFVVQNGEVEKVDEESLDNMGHAETLADFLVWGTENYNSEHLGLILWNHGGGSITGVCFDEKYDQDSLTLMEIDAALLDRKSVV